MAFAAHNFAGMKVIHIGTDLHNLADEFVSNGHGHRNGRPCPFVPLINVQIRTADTGMADVN